jgi:AraC family transcriptional regulator
MTALTLPRGRFFGRAFAARQVDDLGVIVTRYGAGQELPEHAHERPYLVVVAAGGYVERAGGREHRCAAGTVVLNLAGVPHSDRFLTANTEVVNVELGERWVEAVRRSAPRPAPQYVRCAAAAARARLLSRELQSDDAAAPLAIHGLVAELLALAVRRSHAGGRRPPHWLALVTEILRVRFAAPPSLTELAAAAGVPPARVARALRRHEGCSLGEFVRRVRAERAHAEIAGSDRPLAAIAMACGYCDQSHLTREVRRRFGTTPASLRRDRPGRAGRRSAAPGMLA